MSSKNLKSKAESQVSLGSRIETTSKRSSGLTLRSDDKKTSCQVIQKVLEERSKVSNEMLNETTEISKGPKFESFEAPSRGRGRKQKVLEERNNVSNERLNEVTEMSKSPKLEELDASSRGRGRKRKSSSGKRRSRSRKRRRR